MKNIAIDLTSLEDNFSGIERVCLNITKELIKSNSFNFHLFFRKEIKCFSTEELSKSNIFTHIINKNRFISLLFWLPKDINKLNPDIAFFIGFPPSPLIKYNKSIKVIPLIYDLVCFDCPKTMKTFSKFYFQFGIKKALTKSQLIFTISEFSKERIIDRLKYSGKIVVLPMGVTSNKKESINFDLIQKRYNLPDEYLFSLSTLEPRKNFLWMIKALNELYSTDHNIPDIVIGGRYGWKNKEIFTIISNENREKFHFIGFVDDNDLSGIYENSKLFIFPSKYEGFGLPVLESLFYDALPIVSNIPTNVEILGKDYNFIFDLDDENEFYNKLLFLCSLSNYDRLNMTKNQKNKCNFEWSETTKVIIKNFLEK